MYVLPDNTANRDDLTLLMTYVYYFGALPLPSIIDVPLYICKWCIKICTNLL